MKDSPESTHDTLVIGTTRFGIRMNAERMNIDVARSQQKQVAAVFQVLTALFLCVLTIGSLYLAAERARQQDETLVFQAQVLSMTKMAEDPDFWSPDADMNFAALQLRVDRIAGARLEARSLNDIRTFDSAFFDTASDVNAQLDCLAEAIYYEARSEPFRGQLAVAQVVMNRTRHSAYPETICGVVYEGSERYTGCQFSFTCDGSMDREPRGRAWQRSNQIALHAYLGFGADVTRRATHYHTVAVDPHWNDSLMPTRRIGTHIFYRFPTRRERAAGVVRQRDA